MSERVEEQEFQPAKKPTFLVVLAILSFVSMSWSFFQYIVSLLSGPMNQDAWELYEATMYESVGQMNDVGMDGVAAMFEQVIQMSYIANFDCFVINNVLQLITVIIGALGVILMLQLRKIGFHFYVIYSLLPIILSYILFPVEVIPTVVVITQLVLSAIFCTLYALNFKHLK